VSPYLQGASPDDVKRYADAGVDQLILLLMAFDEPGLLQTLDVLRETIVEPASSL